MDAKETDNVPCGSAIDWSNLLNKERDKTKKSK